MPTSLVSTGVQFPDSTIQTSAASPGYIQSPTVYNANLTFAGNLGNSFASDGFKMQAVPLTATTELLLLNGNGSSSGLYAVVWDNTNKVFGSTVLVRSINLTPSSSRDNVAAMQIATNTVLVCTNGNSSGTFNAVVLSVSGTTITVNTAVNPGGGDGGPFSPVLGFRNGLLRMQQMGSTYLVSISAGGDFFLRAITVSGTTPTVSAQFNVMGVNNVTYPLLGSVNNTIWLAGAAGSNRVLVIGTDSGTNRVQVAVLSVSGTTISYAAYNEISTPTADQGGPFSLGLLSSGRFMFTWANSGSGPQVAMVTPSTGVVTTNSFSGGGALHSGQVVGNQMMLFSQANTSVTVFTDNSGTLTVGSTLSLFGISTGAINYFDGTNLYVGSTDGANTSTYYLIGISGNNPVINGLYAPSPTTTSSTGVFSLTLTRYTTSPYYANLEYQGQSGSGPLYTTGNKMCRAGDGAILLPGLNATGVNGGFLVFANGGAASASQSAYFATRSSLANNAMFSAAFSTVVPTRLAVRRVEIS